jgi:hypothetical protein
MLTRCYWVHPRGPLPPRATCCLQTRSDARQPGPSCTFGRKHAKTEIPIALGTTEQNRVALPFPRVFAGGWSNRHRNNGDKGGAAALLYASNPM